MEDVRREDRLEVLERQVDVDDLERRREPRRSRHSSPIVAATSGSIAGRVKPPISDCARRGSSRVAEVR